MVIRSHLPHLLFAPIDAIHRFNSVRVGCFYAYKNAIRQHELEKYTKMEELITNEARYTRRDNLVGFVFERLWMTILKASWSKGEAEKGAEGEIQTLFQRRNRTFKKQSLRQRKRPRAVAGSPRVPSPDGGAAVGAMPGERIFTHGFKGYHLQRVLLRLRCAGTFVRWDDMHVSACDERGVWYGARVFV